MNTSSRDLAIASGAVESMAAATDFSVFERHWQDYLMRIEMAWEAAHRAMQSKGGSAQKWISSNAQIRKKDPLLRYLKNARDAETHVVEPTLGQGIALSVRDRLGRPFRLDSATVELKDGTLTFNLDTPDEHLDWIPELLPGDPHLKRFKCRGAWHNPPYEHMGQRLSDIHPVAVSKLGLEFYRARVNEAEEFHKKP